MRSVPKIVRHYGSVYFQFIATSFARDSSFRANFILLVLVDIAFYASALFSTGFIFNQVASIGAWNREQFLFFLSFMLVIDYLHMMTISANLWEFSESVRNGQLDYALLRPVSPIFTSFLRNFRSGSVANGFVIVPVLIVFGRRAGLSAFDWAVVPPLIALGLTLLTSVEIVLMCSMFWIIDGTSINFLRMQMQSVARMPDFVYGTIFRRVFTVIIPILLVGSAPMRFIIHHHDWKPLCLMILLLAFVWLVIRIAWSAGLRKYESASS